MIDLTSKEEDKKNFITKVALKEGTSDYIIYYADGHEESKLFTIPSLNETFMNMEKQFFEYKDEFTKREFDVAKKATLKKLMEAIMALASVYLTTAIDMPDFLKVLIIMLVAVGSVCYQRTQSDVEHMARNNINVILTAEEFLAHKDKFNIKITNPSNGKEEDWYLLTLSDIEEVYEPRLVSKLASSITPDVCDEERHITEETLKLKMKLS